MIRYFMSDKDFNDIEQIAENYWKNEVSMDLELQSFIYPFLVRYYMFENKYSYVIENNGVKAFLLSRQLNENNKALDYFYANLASLKPENKEKAIEYLQYIEYNHNKVFSYMNDNDIDIGLIASVIYHGGTDLINNLISDAKKNNINSIYLWTDETCNYGFYERFSFKLLEEYFVTLYGRRIKTYIYKIDLEKRI